MKKMLKYEEDVRGILGESTGYNDLHVGDVLNVKSYDGSYENNLMVVYDKRRNRFSVLGFLGYSLSEIYNKYNIEKVASYKIVTKENIKSLSNFEIELKDLELPKLTLDDIKDKLGYDFQLII